MTQELPITAVIGELIAALSRCNRAVLCAPPGAGKTTNVPLAILERLDPRGKIIMLEPRRLAARAAAERMAETLGENVGETVGYRIRGDAKTSPSTKIEVVTEGILTRMIQNDPELPGIDTIIFDEFHERSLNADLGLALTLEIADALRDDLRILVMSATLDADPIAALLGDAPVVVSQGRSFPVTPHWLPRPLDRSLSFEQAMTDLILSAMTTESGGVLAFCPGEAEIKRIMTRLAPQVSPEVKIFPLYGAMDFALQRQAIQPMTSGRKVVLATSIAETSLTIQDISIVVDGGLARRAKFDPATGMSRLITEKVSRAEATQRMGRAGRVRAGHCFKLWSKAEEGTLPAFAPPEIETSDLTGLALELAQWGSPPDAMAFLTQPNPALMAEAQQVLGMLGALSPKGQITKHGKELARAPVHPRLGHMLAMGGAVAAPMAALLSDRDILNRGAPADIALRITALKDAKSFEVNHPYQLNRPALTRVRAEAKRLAKLFRADTGHSPEQLFALAFPDRIGQRRKGDSPRYVLSNGKGVTLTDGDPLGHAPYIVCVQTDGRARDATVRQAIQIHISDLRDLFADQITWDQSCAWSKREKRVVARKQERLGALVLTDQKWTDAPKDDIKHAMLDGIRDIGFHWPKPAQRFLARVALVGDQLPDFSAPHLMDTLEDWLLPYLDGVTTAAQWQAFDPLPALRARLDWGQMSLLDAQVPAAFTTPLGRQIPIDYDTEHPTISLRLQEMFGQKTHPMVGKTPLRVTLLSPAQRPVQTTMDLPGFWKTSYQDVRKDMRGQYPKHPWPEDPTIADPTLRTKRRS